MKQIVAGLVSKRLVRIEDTKVLGIFPWSRTYLTESLTREKLIRQLRNDILVYRGDVNDSTALAGLIEACMMWRILSTDRDELKMIRSQIKRIIKDTPVAGAVGQTIRQVQAAIIASVTASVVASTSAND
jgi:hypothetical protein